MAVLLSSAARDEFFLLNSLNTHLEVAVQQFPFEHTLFVSRYVGLDVGGEFRKRDRG